MATAFFYQNHETQGTQQQRMKNKATHMAVDVRVGGMLHAQRMRYKRRCGGPCGVERQPQQAVVCRLLVAGLRKAACQRMSHS
jgi:hypothetical protein